MAPPRDQSKGRDARAAALDIISTLRAAGHVALLAGGCVRDMLLGRVPKDYDVVTDATPKRVQELFPRARQVGAQFGVMLLRKYRHDVEVATFRSDGTYSDGRHPDQVTFGTEEEDAARRDFTVNGMFYDPALERVIDHVAGRADLRAGVIRTIGVAADRFAEDHLRMLRAVRFAAALDFTVAPETLEAIRLHAAKLGLISAERVWQELTQILTGPNRTRGWALLLQTGLRSHLSPVWPAAPAEDELAGHRLEQLPEGSISPALGLAAVLCARTSAEAGRVCRALRQSNRMTTTVTWLVKSLPRAAAEQELELADLKLLRAKEAWDDLRTLLRADLQARQVDLTPYDQLMARAAALVPDRISPPPLLTGDDLAEMGVPQGPLVGRILKQVYRAQLNEQLGSEKEARALARSLLE